MYMAEGNTLFTMSLYFKLILVGNIFTLNVNKINAWL